ncbi:MAG: PD40 domain-containing protein [Deltaproteobacteria bacterium]|nr:PD40 domain-containing protein [Deltaproteobacteria bacterium]
MVQALKPGNLFWLLPLLLGGCVRGGFHAASTNEDSFISNSDTGSPDTGSPDTGSVDASPPHTWAFKDVQAVDVLNSGLGDDDPALPGSMLEILFDSNRTGKGLWRATRTSITEPWSAPQPIALFSEGSAPSFAQDGLTLHLVVGGDFYRTTRSEVGGVWAAPVALVELNTADRESALALTSDGLYMVLSRQTSTDTLLASSRSTLGEPWSVPQEITELLEESGGNSSPWLNPTGTMLLFASNRAGGAGLQDIWVATRASRAIPFDAPQPMTSINSAQSEEDPWLSPDGMVLFFARDVGGIKSLYTAHR